ncbi:MAG: ATP-binding protein [Nitrospiraceae bacterium]
MRKRISLQSLITLSVLSIGLLSGTIGLAYAYWHAKQSLQTTIGLTFQELSRQSSDKVGLILAKEIEWVTRLSALPEVRDAVKEGVRLTLDKPELQKWREEQRRYFRSLIVLDRQGYSVGGMTSDTTRAHYNKQPWWSVVFELKQPWVGDLHLEETGEGYWELAVPIFDNDLVLGALKVVIGTDELFTSILRSRIGETGHVMLVADEGTVLACAVLSPALHAKTGIPLGKRDPSGRSAVSSAMWTEVENDTHGSQGVIVGISPVTMPATIVQERAWYILVRQDPQETYAPLHVLMWKLAGFWVVAVALVVWLRWRLARRIVQPINALVEKIRLLGEGQGPLALKATTPGGIVEIDTLAASFDDLAERLERASREGQRYIQQLELANREIATSEEHYRTLWNHSVDSKVIVDAQGIVRDVNRRGEMKLGRRTEELIGTHAADLLVESDRIRFQPMLQEVLGTGKEKDAGEVHVPAPAGAMLTMELDLVPVEKVGSGTQAVMLQLSDVTEKKQLEEQLLRSERLASLSQFASMFAHDLRNPLAGIKKTLELIGQRHEFQAEPLGRWCEDLRFTTDLLLGMINDMLDVYQESYSGLSLITSNFSVQEVLQEIVHLFRSDSEAREVTISLNVPTSEIMLTADRRRLQRVVMNLVHNALKYSPARGTIGLTLRLERQAPQGILSGRISGPLVLIEVEDEGPGMNPEELPHLFEMFFRKKDGHDLRIGRGLGLHFCRLVVEAHQGSILAGNRVSGGAVFSVMLPLNEEPPCP